MRLRKNIAILCLMISLLSCTKKETYVLDLAGEWKVTIEQDSDERLEGEYNNQGLDILLPGTLDGAGIGTPSDATPELNKDILYQLNRKVSYIGAAWYQRYIIIPESWEGRDVELEMERVIWKSSVWIDGHFKGSDNSLITGHTINLGQLEPGSHMITICIDNSQQYDIFDNSRGRDLAHAYTETTQVKWNGIIGDFKLRAVPKFQVEYVDVYSNVEKGEITVDIKNNSASSEMLKILVKDASGKIMTSKVQKASLNNRVVLAADYKQWNDVSPTLYTLEIKEMDGATAYATRFGFREIKSIGKDMFVNNKRVFLRGTLECCIFPLTGHPPMDKAGWHKVFGTAKSYGLNHIRFHSWCPPQAAFDVADELGFYLQVELPSWSLIYGQDTAMVNWMEREGHRMLKEYGNHPSFCMMAMGNELQGDYSLLTNYVEELQAKDARHLYTTTAFTFEKPYTSEPNVCDEYWITQWTKDGWVRGQGVFDQLSPSFDKDYCSSIEFLDIPLITHEIGQYSVYPNLKEIEKYTGVLAPLNFEAIKNDLEAKGRLHLADDYLKASGHLAKILYKEEVERALKTPGISGFQLLDLHDFPGQGTALVGLLDAFWDSKGIITGDEFKQFCSEFVPLLKFEKATYTNDETFSAKAEVANYWQDIEEASFTWKIMDDEVLLREGRILAEQVSQGSYAEVGNFDFDLSEIHKATKLDITLELDGSSYINSWSIWVYPKEQSIDYKDVVKTNKWNVAHKALLQGKKVLLSPELDDINGIEGKFVQVFWSPVHFPNQPGTMGLLCDDSHPALNGFPTEFHTNWQWWDLCKSSKTLDMTNLEATHLVTVVDNFFKNRNLSNLFEVKVGEGKLIFSGMDLNNNLDNRAVAQCLEKSLVDYMKTSDFAPVKSLTFEQIENEFNKSVNIKEEKIGDLYDEDGF